MCVCVCIFCCRLKAKKKNPALIASRSEENEPAEVGKMKNRDLNQDRAKKSVDPASSSGSPKPVRCNADPLNAMLKSLFLVRRRKC